MKKKLANFLKPRVWTVFFALLMVAWQYVYAYRGIDIESLHQIQVYFGFSMSSVNWDNFLIRAVSLGAIWLLVAFLIFLMLWVAESLSVGSYNRKLTKKYVNQPKADYSDLLRTKNIGFRSHFMAQLWFSAGIILIPVGFFLVSGIMESIRSYFVLTYITAVLESGAELDFNDITISVVSFLATLPFWYLFAALDTWCFITGRKEQTEAQLQENHFAIPIDTRAPGADEETESVDPDENDSNLPAGHVI